MESERCETCRFWLREHETTNAGHCRRFPPTGDGEYAASGNLYWCGEWRGHLQVDAVATMRPVPQP
jgi:hypothetical protein